jgi:ABC-2 type transport system ATP-binding protein
MKKDIISIQNLIKSYKGGFLALQDVSLNIQKGEIFALLGPNGAGKTTMINIICGIVNSTSGQVSINGFDIKKDFRKSRALVGLVPQELTTDAFETVWNTVSHSRGLFGKSPQPSLIEKLLKDLSLWDKKDNKLMTLSGGMKRRVMIAKALSHEPQILFLDEPTAGVDVELRRGMWEQVHQLREQGVTVILTTHYLEEAEEMADRIGVIQKGKLIIVEDKTQLMKKLGSKELTLELVTPLAGIPNKLKGFDLSLGPEGNLLIYHYDSKKSDNRIYELFDSLKEEGIRFHDLHTSQSSLEDIFVNLVKEV